MNHIRPAPQSIQLYNLENSHNPLLTQSEQNSSDISLYTPQTNVHQIHDSPTLYHSSSITDEPALPFRKPIPGTRGQVYWSSRAWFNHLALVFFGIYMVTLFPIAIIVMSTCLVLFAFFTVASAFIFVVVNICVALSSHEWRLYKWVDRSEYQIQDLCGVCYPSDFMLDVLAGRVSEHTAGLFCRNELPEEWKEYGKRQSILARKMKKVLEALDMKPSAMDISFPEMSPGVYLAVLEKRKTKSFGKERNYQSDSKNQLKDLNDSRNKSGQIHVSNTCEPNPQSTPANLLTHSNLSQLSTPSLQDTPVCVICFDQIAADSNEPVRELRCRHVYHKRCIDVWFLDRGADTCPLCGAKYEINN